jgi:hypothetical protein
MHAFLKRWPFPLFVSTPDLLRYLPSARWVPVIPEDEWFTSMVPIESSRPKPRVLHLPSNRASNSSDEIEPTLLRLASEGLIEFRCLTGIPPTAGFFAKTYVILAAVQAGGPATILAVIAVLNAAIAAFYYLRVIVYLFMRDPAEPAVLVAEGPMLRAGLLIAAIGTVALGLAPTPIIEAVIQALAT